MTYHAKWRCVEGSCCQKRLVPTTIMLAWSGWCSPAGGFAGSFCQCMSKASKASHHRKQFSLGVVRLKSHYDSLGVTPHATHSDIKSAYYKLSMTYHPDKNKGSESASDKFRDISAAYEVLGNFKLRRLYDKGILHTAGPGFAPPADGATSQDDATTKFYKSRMQRNAPPPPTGRTPIYDFDEWSRSHYGASFARAEAAKQKYERKMSNVVEHRQDIQKELFIFSIAFLAVAFFFMTLTNSESFDKVETPAKLSVDKSTTDGPTNISK